MTTTFASFTVNVEKCLKGYNVIAAVNGKRELLGFAVRKDGGYNLIVLDSQFGDLAPKARQLDWLPTDAYGDTDTELLGTGWLSLEEVRKRAAILGGLYLATV